MKRTLFLLIGLIISGYSNGQTQVAENGLDSTKTQLTKKQTELLYEKTKEFPENTQVSIAVIENGKVEFVGIKRTNNSIVQVENHKNIFEIGSISKVFTSTLLSNFLINNQLELDSSIQKFVDFEIKANETITFKELANHTSGLPRLPSNLDLLLVDNNNPYKNYGEENLKTYLTEIAEVKQKPGTAFEYSNLGAGLLGYILASHSNSTYEKLLNELVFVKYEMSSSTTLRTELKGELIKGLDKNGKETSNWDMNVLVGAGGILSTVEDLSKFALAQFDDNNSEIQLTQQPTFLINENLEMGLGWHILKTDSGLNKLLCHGGGTGGYTSFMALDKENENGIIILSNVSAYNDITGEIEKLCFGLIETMGEEK